MANGEITVHLTGEPEVLKAMEHAKKRLKEQDAELAVLHKRVRELEADAKRLAAQLKRVVGVHNAPNDCYATGPLTGDTVADLISCPSCEAIEMLGALDHAMTPEVPRG